MPEADASALKIAREVCEQQGLKLRIYNISTLGGRMRARLKGVKKTPTILIGNESLVGVIRKEELVSSVQEFRHRIQKGLHS